MEDLNYPKEELEHVVNEKDLSPDPPSPDATVVLDAVEPMEAPAPPVDSVVPVDTPSPPLSERRDTDSAEPRPPPLASPSPVPSPAPRIVRRSSTTSSQGQSVSLVHITSALDTIAASKEAKRSAPLKDSVQTAIELLRSGQAGGHPREIFEPLRLACETRNEKLMIASLDCISKLVSHSFLTEFNNTIQDYVSPPASPTVSSAVQATSLADLVTHTITSAYTESTPDPVSLQIVKALLSLVLSTTILVHHSSLLKAVRTVYNVFLLSQDTTNQMVAQGGLTQMVNHVFMRCRTPQPSSEFGLSATLMERRLSIVSRKSSIPSHVTADAIPSPPESPAGANGKRGARGNGDPVQDEKPTENGTVHDPTL